jgi:hypothetical protein
MHDLPGELGPEGTRFIKKQQLIPIHSRHPRDSARWVATKPGLFFKPAIPAQGFKMRMLHACKIKAVSTFNFSRVRGSAEASHAIERTSTDRLTQRFDRL